MAWTTERTSLSHPLQIAAVSAPGGGIVGVTFCPGKCQPHAMTGTWRRDLELDLKIIKAWGGGVVVTLVTSAELAELKVAHIGEAAEALGLTWLHLPITDVSIPSPEWERAWTRERSRVHAELNSNGGVVVHCKGGLGRAGTVAARILIERGMPPAEAIREVRHVRPGAIQTAAQEAYVRALRTGDLDPRA
jgi:protein-tyrosine phosphatase